MNPMALLKLKGLLNAFRENHPKVIPFFGVAGRYVKEGTVIELKVKNEEGKDLLCNIKVTQQDIELFREIKNFAANSANAEAAAGGDLNV
ncbi:MAG: hypothetical protein MJ062_06815 [Oscillospiraceae bacterium]|nr:hypothetical protein [Oscillospiraceae bacterium]